MNNLNYHNKKSLIEVNMNHGISDKKDTSTYNIIIRILLVVIFGISCINAQEFWMQQNGPYGGSALAIAADTNGTLYAGTQYGGLQKSDDNGKSWFQPGWFGTVRALIVREDGALFFPGYNSVNRSTDGGVTYQDFNSGLPERFSALSFATNSSSDIFVGSDSGVFVSRNDGEKWLNITADLPSKMIRQVFVNKDNHIFVNVYTLGVYRSVDNGASWQDLSGGLPVGAHMFTDFIENSQRDVFLSVLGSGVYRLPKGNSSWTAINAGLDALSVFALAINTNGDMFCGTADNGVFRRLQGANEWTNVNNGLQNTYITDIYINKNSNKIFLATQYQNGGGIYSSTNNGVSWFSENRGFRGVRAWDMAVNPTNNHLFVGSYYNGVFRSVNGGESWEPVSNGLTQSQSTYVRTIASAPNGDLYIATYGGGAYKSDNNGDSWVKTSPKGLGEFFHAVSVRNDGSVFLGGYSGTVTLLRSDDDGNTWNDISNNITTLSVRDIDFNPAGEIYVSTDAGGIFKFQTIGQNWNKISDATLDAMDIFELSINSASTIFVGAWAQGAFKSKDDGKNWQAIDELGTQSLDFVYDSKGTIYAGAYDPWRSKDGGNTWQNINPGMGETVMESYIVDNDDFVYAGTSKGVYKTIEPSGAVKVEFKVMMATQDGFDSENQDVVVRGHFNNWGEQGDLVLEPQGGDDMLYIGEWVTASPQDGIVDGLFAYKFVITGDPEIPELLPERVVEWDGMNDLPLAPVWFDEQFAFSRIKIAETNPGEGGLRGVAWGDYDNDEYADLYIANLSGRDLLLHNEQDGKFKSNTNLAENQGTFNPSWCDFDNDGDLDLFVVDLGGENNLLYENSGLSEFTRVTSGPVVSEGGNSSGGLWLDYDRDSYTDLFISNLGSEKNFLYKNLNGETFQKIDAGAIVNDIGDSWGSVASDYNNDGYVDIFVTNSGGELAEKNALYKNQGDGSFISVVSGNPIVEVNQYSYGGSWGDYDNDGNQDLFVANLGGIPNELYKNMGGGSFKKITTSLITLDSASSRSSSWIDYDNNGWLDLFVVNSSGNNLLYRNMGNEVFEQGDFGPLIYDQHASRGCAWADYDHDGDLDAIVTGPTDSAVYVYRNNLTENNWVEFRLKGTISNASAIGARVLLKAVIDGTPRWQMREISTQTGSLSQNEMIAHFGVGDATNIDSVIVVWPGGTEQMVLPPAINNRIEVIEQIPDLPTPDLLKPENGAIGVNLYPAFDWIVPDSTDVAAYQLQVSPSVKFDDLVLDQPDIPASFYQYPTVGAPLLQSATNYFWRVRPIMNGGGEGNWSNIWNFQSKRGTSFTEVLKIVSPPDGSTEIPVTPTLEWAWIEAPPTGSGDITYDIEVSRNQEFTEIVMQKFDFTGTSLAVAEYALGFNTTYYWRVVAKTQSTIYVSPNPPWTFTTEPFVGTVSILFPANGATNVSIPTPLKWTKVPADGYRIQVAPSTDFSKSQEIVWDVLAVADDTLIFIHEAPGYIASEQYYWRVGVISGDTVPATNWTIPFNFQTFDNQLDADFFLTFPEHERADEYTARDYRLVGIPGNSEKQFDEIFTGIRGQDWMAYWDNGNNLNSSSPEDYLIPHSVSSTFTFVTGRAFWVINKGDIRINENNLGLVPLNENAEAHIDVHGGYNLITCPFAEGVDWNQVKILNNLPPNTPLYEYDTDQGKFIMSSSLEVGTGYYFINADTDGNALASPLRIPFNPIYTLPKVNVENNYDWQLKIDLQSGNTGDETSIIAMSKNSKAGFDQLEYNKPRIMQGIASVYFERPDWNDKYPIFGSDIRPEINESEIWTMSVYTPDAAKSEISFNGIEDIPMEFAVALIDKKAARAQNLRESATYVFKPSEEITEFELLVGQSDLVKDRVSEIVPQDFALEQNYPNPFNPTTTIPVALPKAAQIKVTIYNILGKVIQVVYNGMAETGRHYLPWNGTDMSGKRVASGLYFYRLEIEGRQGYTKKMVLMK
jgi:photosystem II stability/assembly factor-like uncharacterized protein